MSFHVLAKFIVIYAEMLQLKGTSSPWPPIGAPHLDPAGGLRPPGLLSHSPPKLYLKLRLCNNCIFEI